MCSHLVPRATFARHPPLRRRRPPSLRCRPRRRTPPASARTRGRTASILAAASAGRPDAIRRPTRALHSAGRFLSTHRASRTARGSARTSGSRRRPCRCHHLCHLDRRRHHRAPKPFRTASCPSAATIPTALHASSARVAASRSAGRRRASTTSRATARTAPTGCAPRTLSRRLRSLPRPPRPCQRRRRPRARQASAMLGRTSLAWPQSTMARPCSRRTARTSPPWSAAGPTGAAAHLCADSGSAPSSPCAARRRPTDRVCLIRTGAVHPPRRRCLRCRRRRRRRPHRRRPDPGCRPRRPRPKSAPRTLATASNTNASTESATSSTAARRGCRETAPLAASNGRARPLHSADPSGPTASPTIRGSAPNRRRPPHRVRRRTRRRRLCRPS